MAPVGSSKFVLIGVMDPLGSGNDVPIDMLLDTQNLFPLPRVDYFRPDLSKALTLISWKISLILEMYHKRLLFSRA